ncbi:MAG TPA: hypothetical protein VJL80_04305 [Aeromicrobium sp.]|nr:hypothetical protein [Aeromicrobium sp.]HKY57242.1 hypothetical protein [Aeromicrobium sp.]
MTAPTLTASSRSNSPAVKYANLAVKLGLVVLIVMSLIDPDLGGVKAKAGGSRAFVYPLAMLLVPALWWAFYRAKSFPWLGDLLLCLPWFTDTLGNRLNLYDTVSWFDDWMHFMNWGFLTAGFLVITLPRGLPWWRALERGLAFGMTTAALWEIAEYLTFIRWSPELATAYEDTLGDLVLDLAGTVLAVILVWASRRSSPETVTGV